LGTELAGYRSTAYFSPFSWVRNTTFAKYPYQVNGRFMVALVRESLTFEATGSSNLLSIVN
jgi:hypothetical protein